MPPPSPRCDLFLAHLERHGALVQNQAGLQTYRVLTCELPLFQEFSVQILLHHLIFICRCQLCLHRFPDTLPTQSSIFRFRNPDEGLLWTSVRRVRIFFVSLTDMLTNDIFSNQRVSHHRRLQPPTCDALLGTITETCLVASIFRNCPTIRSCFVSLHGLRCRHERRMLHHCDAAWIRGVVLHA